MKSTTPEVDESNKHAISKKKSKDQAPVKKEKKREVKAASKPSEEDFKEGKINETRRVNLFAPKSTDVLFGSDDGSCRTFEKELKFRPKDLIRNPKNPRLRTKTRSKQKNKKKDNRSEEVKKQKFGS